MKSSSGFYRPGLDQLRGFAIYLVFCWHFVHSDNIVTLTGEQAAWWPLNLINQGFAGVSLFMVLSGYLFAGLTEGRDIRWGAFLRNRALRLLPLLTVVMLAALVKFAAQGKLDEWLTRLAWGWLMPSLPQGAWSITVEAHYYLLLPLLLWLGRRHPAYWMGALAVAMGVRAVLSQHISDLDAVAGYTIVGRFDQFVLGMLAWHVRGVLKGRHLVWALAALGYSAYVYTLDHLGAPWGPRFREDTWWIWLPTVDGLFFALTVAWYDTSFEGRKISAPGRLAILAGKTSYSMYLLHTFWVFAAARWIHVHVWPMNSAQSAIAIASVLFVLALPLAMLSYRFIELPFLRVRRSYGTHGSVPQTGEAPEALPREARQAA